MDDHASAVAVGNIVLEEVGAFVGGECAPQPVILIDSLGFAVLFCFARYFQSAARFFTMDVVAYFFAWVTLPALVSDRILLAIALVLS